MGFRPHSDLWAGRTYPKRQTGLTTQYNFCQPKQPVRPEKGQAILRGWKVPIHENVPFLPTPCCANGAQLLWLRPGQWGAQSLALSAEMCFPNFIGGGGQESCKVGSGIEFWFPGPQQSPSFSFPCPPTQATHSQGKTKRAKRAKGQKQVPWDSHQHRSTHRITSTKMVILKMNFSFTLYQLLTQKNFYGHCPNSVFYSSYCTMYLPKTNLLVLLTKVGC